MNPSMEDRVAAIPAWVEEEFRRELRSGQRPSIPRYTARCSGQEHEVRAYLELLEFVERTPFAGDSAEPLALPARLGDYHLQQLLGRGAMSAVYRARHLPTQTEVALKVLTIARPAMRARFTQEATALQRLRHRAIVRLLQTTVIDGLWLHVLPLINGEPLNRHVRDWSDNDRRISGGRLLQWARETASALTHAHDQGVLHRDIKPENLLITDDNRIYLTDFGLSRVEGADHRLSTAGDVIGTPRYMAPEQFRGYCDARSDIYAWGVTMWELMTGRTPWDTTTADRASVDVPSAVSLPPVGQHAPWLPMEVALLIDQCCHFDPRYRPRAAAELYRALNDVTVPDGCP